MLFQNQYFPESPAQLTKLMKTIASEKATILRHARYK